MVDNKYDDIINLPYHVSKTRPQMSIRDRAAQFAPFAALAGHDEAVKETARLTDDCRELDEDTMTILSAKIMLLQEKIEELPEVTFTCFIPDERKSGGAYVSKSGIVRRIDEVNRIISMTNGETILIDQVVDINSDLFSVFEI